MEIRLHTLIALALLVIMAGLAPLLATFLPDMPAAAERTVQALPTATTVPTRGMDPATWRLLADRSRPARLPTPLSAQVIATVNTAESARLNIRRGPGLGYPVMGTAPRGMALEVTAISVDGQWLQVLLPDLATPGWIYAALASVTGPLASLPGLSAADLPPAP